MDRRFEPIGSLDEGLLRALRRTEAAEAAYEDFMTDHSETISEERRLRTLKVDAARDVDRLEEEIRRKGYANLSRDDLIRRYGGDVTPSE